MFESKRIQQFQKFILLSEIKSQILQLNLLFSQKSWLNSVQFGGWIWILISDWG